MKEHPIIFNDEMVRAILDGRKTQTRRVIKLDHEHGFQNPVIRSKNGTVSTVSCRLTPTLCPLGQPGDRIWVRETWALSATHLMNAVVLSNRSPVAPPPTSEKRQMPFGQG